MTSASVTISRASLSLADLAISGDGTGAYGLTEKGLGQPVKTVRATFAEASAHTEGQLMTQAVLDIASLPLEVLVQGASESDLQNNLDALENALFQFRYTTTVTVGGVGRAWSSMPTTYQIVDGSVAHAHWSQFLEVVSFAIPVQPTPVSL